MTDIFSDAHDDIFEAMADIGGAHDATYDGSTVTVIVEHDLTRWGDAVNIISGAVMVSVRRSQVMDRPRRGDQFVLTDGTVYEVERTEFSDDYIHRCMALEVVA